MGHVRPPARFFSRVCRPLIVQRCPQSSLLRGCQAIRQLDFRLVVYSSKEFAFTPRVLLARPLPLAYICPTTYQNTTHSRYIIPNSLKVAVGVYHTPINEDNAKRLSHLDYMVYRHEPPTQCHEQYRPGQRTLLSVGGQWRNCI